MFDEKEIEDLCKQFLNLDDNLFLDSVDDLSNVDGGAVFNEMNFKLNKVNNLSNNNPNNNYKNNSNENGHHHHHLNYDNNNATYTMTNVSLEKSDLNTQLDIINENFIKLNTFDCYENTLGMRSIAVEESTEAPVNAALPLSKKQDEVDNEFKEIDEKLISPDAPVKQDYYQRNEWVPSTCQLWRSGPSSLNLEQPSLNHVPHMDLTLSETYSNDAQSLNASLSSSKRIYSHQQLGVKVEMVYSLLSMLDMNNREDMSKTFLAMSSSAESCNAMRQSGCLPLLIQLIHSSELNKEVRQRAAEALHNVVHSQTDERRRKREIRVLKLLQQVREFCDDLKISSAQEILDSKETEKHPINAIGTLMKFSFDADHRQAICALGGLHAISELMQIDHEVHGNTSGGSPCITLRRYAGMSLTNLTFGDCKNKALLCSFSKFMCALVDQLKSSCEDLRQVTASVIRNLSWRADSESKEALRCVGTVTNLTVSAMEAKKESTLKSILSALWNLSAHCSLNKVDICSVPGALAFLVKMLKYKSSSNTLAIVENAGGILRNISSHIAVREDYRQILRENNCFEILLEQLKSPSLTIVSNACGTLWNLSARCPTDQRKLWEMGATGMLRSLVQSKHKMISMGSSAALKNLLAANPNENLLTNLDSTAKSLGLQNLPTLFVRKKRALEQELNITLAETCENIDPGESSSRYLSLQSEVEVKKGNGPQRSESRDSVQSTQSDSTYERVNQISLKNEDKLFENKNITLHDSLDEKSMPRKMVDQKLMRRYKSSMIPTPAFKKVNQDKINEKAKEESIGENGITTDFSENGCSDANEKGKIRIPLFSNRPKGKNDVFTVKGEKISQTEDGQVRKSHPTEDVVSNFSIHEDISNPVLKLDKRIMKKLNTCSEIEEVRVKGKKRIEMEKKKENLESEKNSGTGTGTAADSLTLSKVGKYGCFAFEEIPRFYRKNTREELNDNSKETEVTECSACEDELSRKIVVERSEKLLQKVLSSVNFVASNDSAYNVDGIILDESSNRSKYSTSGAPSEIIEENLELHGSGGEISSRKLFYCKAAEPYSSSLLKFQNTGNLNEEVIDVVTNNLPDAAESISFQPARVEGLIGGIAENTKPESTNVSSQNVTQLTFDARSEMETLNDENVDIIHLKTFSGSIYPKFKVGSPITDSKVLQMDANKICREIKKQQDFEMCCSLTSEMSLVSSSSFLDTGDYSLFECSADPVDFNDSEIADPLKVSSKLRSVLLRKPTTSCTVESVSLPSLESLKSEQIEALDLDSSILSVASITSEVAETYSKDFDAFNTYAKTYKVDTDKELVEDTTVDATLVFNEDDKDDTLNADLLQNNADIFDEDNSLHSQENLPLDTENFDGETSRQVRKKLTPKEKRKTFQDRYRTYTIRDLNGCDGTSAIPSQGVNLKKKHDGQRHATGSRNDFFNNEKEKGELNERQLGMESFLKMFPVDDFETSLLMRKFDKEENFTERFVADSKSLNDLLSICPRKRKELVDNAKLVAFSLKTAVQDSEAILDSEMEEAHVEIDTATYNKSFQEDEFESFQHYEESIEEEMEKKGARILKPNENSHDKQEETPKGIRGRRKPLNSSPLRMNSSPLNSAKISEKPESEISTLPMLHREGTFTKEDGPAFKKNEVKNPRGIPVFSRQNDSRNSIFARPTDGNKLGQVSGNVKRVPHNQVSRIVRPQSTFTPKTNERKPELDSSKRRPASTTYRDGSGTGISRKPSMGLTSPKMRNSSSSHNVRTESISGSGCFTKPKNLQAVKSQSDASLNLVACKDMVSSGKQRSPRKEITSKVASLWRKVEETKQQNKSFKDNRVWISSGKNPKADEVLVIEQEEILDIPTRQIVHSLTCQTLSDEAFEDINSQSESSKTFRDLSKFRGLEEKMEKMEKRNVISAVVPPFNYNPPVSDKAASSKIAHGFQKGSLKITTV